jgi:hypothetical protein
MAKKQAGGDSEMDALMSIEGVDTASIATQINKLNGITEEPVVPDTGKTEPVKTEPVVNTSKTEPIKDIVPDIEAIRTGILNEIFGDQFKTVDDAKKAIPEAFKELTTLRQKTQELTDSLAKKPKHAFASDDIAKFNEFARETGIKDAIVFNKINSTDLANMSDMDALVMQHIIENPAFAGKEPQVRKYFEKKYNVDSSLIDPKRVESGELTQEELDKLIFDHDTNLIGVSSDGAKARERLRTLKEKIKMPEIPKEDASPQSKWTPEVEEKQKTAWTTVNEKMGAEFSTIPITLKGGTEPIVNFVLPEESKKAVLKNALDYVVSNQLEVNEANVRMVAQAMFDDIQNSNRSEIYHAIFERARTITENDLLKFYHNPSPKNNDNPPAVTKVSTEEEQRKKAYELETGR